jgi:DNA polymerase-3 subunit chi
MTQVSFYVLEDSSPQARLLFACKLCEKIYKQGLPLCVHADNEAEARRLDELLWTFRPGSFVPHALHGGEAAVAPVLIGSTPPPDGHAGVLINLAGDVPDFMARFERVAEIVDGAPSQRERMRERYRFYRDRGYPLETHSIGR